MEEAQSGLFLYMKFYILDKKTMPAIIIHPWDVKYIRVLTNFKSQEHGSNDWAD